MVTAGGKHEGLLVEDAQFLQNRLGNLDQLRKNRHFTDVVLQVGSGEVHAHRSVLACASPFLFELFTSDDGNKMREGKVTYKLNGVCERDDIERLVTYAYTGRLNVPAESVSSMYVAANKFRMENVAVACGEFLVQHLHPVTCLQVRATPGLPAYPKIVEKIDTFIQEQLNLNSVERDCVGVARLQLETIHATKEELSSINPRALCMLALEWLRRQLVEEDATIGSLKEKIHMLYIDLDNTLNDCVNIESGEASESELIQDYKKMSRKHSKPNMKIRRKSSTSQAQPTKPRQMLYSRSRSDPDEAEIDANWKLVANSQVAEGSLMAVVTLGGQVAVLSIRQRLLPASPSATPRQSRPGSVEKSDEWVLVPHMDSAKCATGTANLAGYLLVCGGYDRGACLKSVEAYDETNNTWLTLQPMRHGRGRFDLAVLDGRAYAVGGCDGSRELNMVEVLDAGRDSDLQKVKWTSVAPLPLARSNTGDFWSDAIEAG